MDAAETHLAKLRTIQKYLQALPAEDDDDLVLIIDGYDIMLQLPVEIMIERYFTIRQDADARLADRFNMTVSELHKKGMRNTIFWGADKLCWPIEWAAPRCWVVPSSHLGDHAFGPNQGDGSMSTNDPKWLNSGTVLAPVGDLRTYINITMAEIARTYDPEFENKESDQFYLANVWARQEYQRAKKLQALHETPERAKWLAGDDDHKVPDPETIPGEQTEFHVAIEYESSLFQTKSGYESFIGYMKFDQPGYTARMEKDMFDAGASFVPYSISMPAAVYAALVKVYEAAVQPSGASVRSSSARSALPHRGRRGTHTDAADDVGLEKSTTTTTTATTSTSNLNSRSRLSATEWIQSVNLGVNFITRHIYALWHCTGGKEFIDEEYRWLWFYPFAASLLRANALASRAAEVLTPSPLDGREWIPRHFYPADDLQKPLPGSEYGGAFTDFEEEEFLSFGQLCGEYQDVLFAGEMGPPPEAKAEEAKAEEAKSEETKSGETESKTE